MVWLNTNNTNKETVFGVKKNLNHIYISPKEA